MRAVAALTLALLLPGCFWVTTKHEGDTLRRDVGSLDGRVAKQEERIDDRVKQLDESLAKATKLLARSSADVGAEVEKLAADLAMLVGVIQELRASGEAMRAEFSALRTENGALRKEFDSRMTEAEGRLDAVGKAGPATTLVVPPVPLDKDASFAAAKEKLAAGALAEARRALREFAKTWPDDARADDALLLIAEAFTRELQHEKAIAELQRLIDAYPKSDKLAEAMFRAGLAAIELKTCLDARAYLGEVVARHAKSPHAREAKAKLEYLKKNAAKKSVCR